MLTYEDIDHHKKAVVFDLDDVVFPKQDYLLQVYYLFANFLEYIETVPPANDLIDFFKTAYQHHGEKNLFNRAAEAFGIDPKYESNFDRLHHTAQLPAKLLMYKPVLELLLALKSNQKQLMVLTDGAPAMQMNKLRHVEWHGLDKNIKVYFQEELREQKQDPFCYLLEVNKLKADDMVFIYAGSKPPLAVPTYIEALSVTSFMESSNV